MKRFLGFVLVFFAVVAFAVEPVGGFAGITLGQPYGKLEKTADGKPVIPEKAVVFEQLPKKFLAFQLIRVFLTPQTGIVWKIRVEASPRDVLVGRKLLKDAAILLEHRYKLPSSNEQEEDDDKDEDNEEEDNDGDDLEVVVDGDEEDEEEILLVPWQLIIDQCSYRLPQECKIQLFQERKQLQKEEERLYVPVLEFIDGKAQKQAEEEYRQDLLQKNQASLQMLE
ncbi:MAG: hypothetical protein IJJ26_13495 [Victivallales bacterium]|nr:hypothetical protein [Victivallales bacterium]